jgi:hypothetical protein
MSQELDLLPSRVTRLERVMRTLHDTAISQIADDVLALQDRLTALEAHATPAQDLLAALTTPAEPTPVECLQVGDRVRMITPHPDYDDPPIGAIGVVTEVFTGLSFRATWNTPEQPDARTLLGQVEILPPAPCWTATPPTEPGLYWSKHPGMVGPEILQLRAGGRWGNYAGNFTCDASDLSPQREYWTEALPAPA